MGVAKAIYAGKRQRKRPKDKPFGAIEVKTVSSDEWSFLSSTERHVYNILKTFYKGGKAFFKAPFNDLKNRTGIKHGRTLDKALQGLEKRSWIQVTRYAKHGKGRGLRVKANEYNLTGNYDYLRW